MEFLGSIGLAVVLQMVGIFVVILLTHALALFFKLFWKTKAVVRQRTALVLVGLFDFGTTLLVLASDIELQRHLPIALMIKLFIYVALFKFLGEEAALEKNAKIAAEASSIEITESLNIKAKSVTSSINEKAPITDTTIQTAPLSLQENDQTLRSEKKGRWKRWFWAASAPSENSAQTVFRVAGNLTRSLVTLIIGVNVLGGFILLAPGAFETIKNERPEWFGSDHLIEWCDDHYNSRSSGNAHSQEVCTSRWVQYDAFFLACEDAEKRTRELTLTVCESPALSAHRSLAEFLDSPNSVPGPVNSP